MYRLPAISHRSRKPVFRPALTAKRGGAFGPAQIRALSPVAWYRLGVGVTVTGSGVSQWSDQSGNGNHLLQGTDANRPPLQVDNSILFGGVAHYLKTGAFTLNQPESVYILFRQITWTINEVIFDGNASNGGNLGQSATTPNIRLFAGTATTENTNLPLNTYGAVAGVFNGASSITRVNANAEVGGNCGASNMGGFTLGANGTPTVFSNIQVKEVIVFPTAHDVATRTKILRYLARLGGVSM